MRQAATRTAEPHDAFRLPPLCGEGWGGAGKAVGFTPP